MIQAIETPHGTFHAVLGDEGLRELRWPGHGGEAGRARDPVPPAESGPAAARHAARLVQELSAYFAGRGKRFTVPLDLHGHTAFRQTIWRALAEVPPGETVTYGELAARAGRPLGARAAGQACGANPVPIVVPCHRVLAARGCIGGFGGGLERKRLLLRLEGIAWLENPRPATSLRMR